jgi:hypothetical protein
VLGPLTVTLHFGTPTTEVPHADCAEQVGAMELVQTQETTALQLNAPQSPICHV